MIQETMKIAQNDIQKQHAESRCIIKISWNIFSCNILTYFDDASEKRLLNWEETSNSSLRLSWHESSSVKHNSWRLIFHSLSTLTWTSTSFTQNLLTFSVVCKYYVYSCYLIFDWSIETYVSELSLIALSDYFLCQSLQSDNCQALSAS